MSMIFDYHTILNTLAIIGGLVSLVTHLFWIRGIWRGTMRLNLATWLLWSVIDTSVLLTSIFAGAPAPFLSIGFAVGSVLMVAALLFKGTWKWGMLETICALVALACLALWYVAGPLVALVSLTIGKYCIAGIPTMVSAYRYPERGQSWIWLLGTLSAATNIFAGGSWTLEQSFFPTVALAFTAILGTLHLRRKSVDID